MPLTPATDSKAPGKEAPPNSLPPLRTGNSSDNVKDSFVPPKVNRYAQFLITKYDTNHDGLLQKDEWKPMHGHPELIDQNGDGILELEEITKWLVNYARHRHYGALPERDSNLHPGPVSLQKPNSPAAAESVEVASDSTTSSTAAPIAAELTPGERRKNQRYYVPSNRLPTGLPDWFLSKDQDGDGQLTMTEFSPKGGADDVAEFESYDANGDGIMTAKESTSRASSKPASGTNSENPDDGTNNPVRKSAKQAKPRRTTKSTR